MLQVEKRADTDVEKLLKQRENLLRYIKTACMEGLINNDNPSRFILDLIEKSGALRV